MRFQAPMSSGHSIGRDARPGAPPALQPHPAPADRGRARVDERHDGRVVQERDPDVAARLPAVLVVDRFDLARVVVRAAGRDHGVVGGAVVVLHLLDRDDVGRGQVLHVVSGDGQLLLGRSGRHDRGQVVVLHRAERGGGDEVAAELGVVDRADRRAGEHVAHADLGVGPVCRDELQPPRRGGVLRRQQGAAAVADILAGLGGDVLLAEGVRGPDDPGVVHLDPHALDRLVEVQGRTGGLDRGRFDVAAAQVRRVGAGQGVRSQDDRGRQRVAAG